MQTKAVELGISYRGHVLPHDGANRDRNTGESTENCVKRLTGQPVRVMQRGDAVLGINEIRNTFPFFEFDESECEEGLRALKAYQWERDETRNVNKRPNHNWASHYSDALRTSAFFKLSMLATEGKVQGGF